MPGLRSGARHYFSGSPERGPGILRLWIEGVVGLVLRRPRFELG
jgi:hypothetical protein